ncbi:NAD(P)-binding protein [Aspergillus karnatakaensis]|uniref:NAD(P)-binding protein n=1 Tax=Aspergillus karnatakaensis TaxID=1810916 RepID=UPI003CCDCC72
MSSKYSAVHASPKGPGDARPTASQIIDDEGLEGKLSDKVILITGCSSGLGVETARTLYRTGATIYATARDITKAKAALSDIADSRVHFLNLDLNSLASVHACAEEFKSKSTQLNILINNAGVMATPEGRTADGFETQFGVNHLAHFLLFNLLEPVLLSSSTAAFHSRVVILSSSGHRRSTVDFENLNFDGTYDPWRAYGQSKTANIWTANEIERRYGAQGLHALSVHPGMILTELSRHLPAEASAAVVESEEVRSILKNPEQGAATTVLAAVGSEFEDKGGLYLNNCEVATPYDPASGYYGPGYATWAYDEEGAKKLWAKSLELVKLE